jgi:osmotically-inducible protein OsmY
MIVSDRLDPDQGTGLMAPPAGVAGWAEVRLRGNGYRVLKNVACDYRDGVLTLRGRLPSYYLKQVAQETVARIDGVQRIDNQIEVSASP